MCLSTDALNCQNLLFIFSEN
jgi:hypothetical protein